MITTIVRAGRNLARNTLPKRIAVALASGANAVVRAAVRVLVVFSLLRSQVQDTVSITNLANRQTLGPARWNRAIFPSPLRLALAPNVVTLVLLIPCAVVAVAVARAPVRAVVDGTIVAAILDIAPACSVHTLTIATAIAGTSRIRTIDTRVRRMANALRIFLVALALPHAIVGALSLAAILCPKALIALAIAPCCVAGAMPTATVLACHQLT